MVKGLGWYMSGFRTPPFPTPEAGCVALKKPVPHTPTLE